MSTTTNLGLTLAEKGVPIDSSTINNNYNLIDAALSGGGNTTRTVGKANVSFSYSELNSGNIYTKNLGFDFNDYDLISVSISALGLSSKTINDNLGWIQWDPNPDMSGFNLMDIYGQKYTNPDGSAGTTVAWSTYRAYYLKLSDGNFATLLSIQGPGQNGIGKFRQLDTISIPANPSYFEWPKGTTTISMKGYDTGILASNASTTIRVIGYKL